MADPRRSDDQAPSPQRGPPLPPSALAIVRACSELTELQTAVWTLHYLAAYDDGSGDCYVLDDARVAAALGIDLSTLDRTRHELAGFGLLRKSP